MKKVRKKTVKPPRRLLRLLNRLFLLSLAALCAAWWYKTKLPDSAEILPALYQDPIQSDSRDRNFKFDYMGKPYLIEPLADYEIWGLVVSHNNPQGIADIYHDRTSVDIRDLCIIWGENVENELYKQVSFSSNTWDCSYRTKTRGVCSLFKRNQFSNNHLLSDKQAVRDAIQAVSIGDQIHLKGKLIDYYQIGYADYRRQTSLTREDTGNGACEVVFVEDLEMLKQGNQPWHLVFAWARAICLVLAVVIPVLFLWGVYAEQRLGA